MDLDILEDRLLEIVFPKLVSMTPQIISSANIEQVRMIYCLKAGLFI